MRRVLAASIGIHIGEDAGGHHQGEEVHRDKESCHHPQQDEEMMRNGVVILQLYQGDLKGFQRMKTNHGEAGEQRGSPTAGLELSPSQVIVVLLHHREGAVVEPENVVVPQSTLVGFA